jgi:hypothetical protein
MTIGERNPRYLGAQTINGVLPMTPLRRQYGRVGVKALTVPLLPWMSTWVMQYIIAADRAVYRQQQLSPVFQSTAAYRF